VTSSIVTLMLRHAAPGVTAGVAFGSLAAHAATHALAALLVHVSSRDGWTLGGVIVLVIGASAVAAYLPARRAGSIDPAILLRDPSR
jgi:putative ABC transport system permease protein